MGFFKNVGGFVTRNIKSGIKDVGNLTAGVIKPILDSKAGSAAVQGLIAAKTGGASLSGAGGSFLSGIGDKLGGKMQGFDINKSLGGIDVQGAFSNLLGQLSGSTAAQKEDNRQIRLPGEQPTTTNNNNNTMNEVKSFIEKYKIPLIGLAGIGAILLITKKKSKTVTRRRRRVSTSARSKQLAALAKGRRTRLRNLRAKRK